MTVDYCYAKECYSEKRHSIVRCGFIDDSDENKIYYQINTFNPDHNITYSWRYYPHLDRFDNFCYFDKTRRSASGRRVEYKNTRPFVVEYLKKISIKMIGTREEEMLLEKLEKRIKNV